MTMKRLAVIKKCNPQDKTDTGKYPRKDQKYCLWTKDESRILGRHPSEESARKQETAILMNKGASVEVDGLIYKFATDWKKLPFSKTRKETLEELEKGKAPDPEVVELDDEDFEVVILEEDGKLPQVKANKVFKIEVDGFIYRGATEIMGIKAYGSKEELLSTLQKMGDPEAVKTAKVFWHAGRRKYLLIPGNPTETEVAQSLARDDAARTKKELANLQYVTMDELTKMAQEFDKPEHIIDNPYKKREYRERKGKLKKYELWSAHEIKATGEIFPDKKLYRENTVEELHKKAKSVLTQLRVAKGIDSALPIYEDPHGGLFAVVETEGCGCRNRKTAKKWEKLPQGWHKESLESFWNSLGGSVDSCIKEMAQNPKVGDPGAFCSSLADKVLGPDWRKGPRKKKIPTEHMSSPTIKPAPMINRGRNPTALFSSMLEAKKAAAAINDATRSMKASYRKIDDRTWKVEAKGVPLPEFVKILETAGIQSLGSTSQRYGENMSNYRKSLKASTHQADYSGWKNYPTWNVALWIDNDQGEQEYWQEVVDQFVLDNTEEYGPEDTDHVDRDGVLIDLTDALEDYFREQTPDLEGAFGDILSFAMGQVDWREIAETLLED